MRTIVKNKAIYEARALFKQLSMLMLLSLISLTTFATDKIDIERILNMTDTPDGVVFELIGSENSKYLPNALKKVETYKLQLQKKFPDIEIAVVSHGSEQFELTKTNASKENESHDLVKRITLDNIPVHICETHANWRGVDAEDFPDYITISAQGPIQIKQYQELGYLLVVIN